MNSMTTSSQYASYNDFLMKHSVKDNDGQIQITHTRIGDKQLNIYGGKYHISEEEKKDFWDLYYDNVFVKNRMEYLTEVQKNNGPCLVDLDFRYDLDVTERLHNRDHILDIVYGYLEEIKKLYVFKEGTQFPIFVMEKPNVNRCEAKNVTKDGIHIIIGIQMERQTQIYLREKMITALSDILDLPLTNDFEAVLDDGISDGRTNWQMYGSRKPGFDVYKLTYHFNIVYTEDDFELQEKKVNEFNLKKNIQLLSAQYDKHIKLDMTESYKKFYEERLQKTDAITKKKSSNQYKAKASTSSSINDDNSDYFGGYQMDEITNREMLDKAMENILNGLEKHQASFRDIHNYTQILPEKYYKPGESHLEGRKVAYALKRTYEYLFLSWVMMRSKASDFEYSSIPQLLHIWKHNLKGSNNEITKASIIYWAKTDAFEEFERVSKQSINNVIDSALIDGGDYDHAIALYALLQGKFVCSSIKNKRLYVFKGHRWIEDHGNRLRHAISNELYTAYTSYQSVCLERLQEFNQNDEAYARLQTKIKKISEMLSKFKRTNDKNNIFKEACEIFYDENFSKSLDSNPYLMCFTNGVYDFKNKEFRDGKITDYISKCTNIPYIPGVTINKDFMETKNSILDFMNKLFPKPRVCKYMWHHLASVLIGIKREHAFNIYRGSGSNGKSILTDLMAQCLGEYKGIVPVNLVTDKRSTIGNATPEIMALKGIRYAVMQEPKAGMTINEGILKELTGGDPLLGRDLYCSSEKFLPQFSLVVCTNALFEVEGKDDGTWRRMKLVDFISKFVGQGEIYNDTTTYIFPKDKTLNEKLPDWAPIFISMLIDIVNETNGEVIDCQEIIEASRKYRESQDAITQFIIDTTEPCVIEKGDKSALTEMSINARFKQWYTEEMGGAVKKVPKKRELIETIKLRYGEPDNKTKKWYTFKFIEVPDDNLENEIMG